MCDLTVTSRDSLVESICNSFYNHPRSGPTVFMDGKKKKKRPFVTGLW